MLWYEPIGTLTASLSVTVRLAVQPSAKQKSTLWANYQCNTWLWVGSKQESRRGITLYAMACDIRGKKRKLHENRLSTVR